MTIEEYRAAREAFRAKAVADFIFNNKNMPEDLVPY